MQSTLEHFIIKKAMVFATGGNSTALFFLWCGKMRYVECVWCVEWACHVCIYGNALQSNMAHANSQTNQTGWLWSHRFLCRSPDVAANDKCRQSTWIQPATSHIVHIPHLPTPHHKPYTPSPFHTGSLNQLSVLSNLPGARLQPSNYSVQPFGSSPLICPTHPPMHACNPAYPDNWWAACATLCAFHFSLLALLRISLSLSVLVSHLSQRSKIIRHAATKGISHLPWPSLLALWITWLSLVHLRSVSFRSLVVFAQALINLCKYAW